MSDNQKAFLRQGTLLAAAGILCRIIGLIYKIPLVNIIGDDGMGVFNTAFSIYNIVLLISSYSLPTAVSKLISARFSRQEYRSAYRVNLLSLLFGFSLALLAALFMYFGAPWLSGTVMNMPEAEASIRVLSLAVLLMGSLGALRGYFQGQCRMTPTAYSQILEQVVHVIVSLVLAGLLVKEGIARDAGSGTYYASAYGAAGATSGTVAGAFAALVFLFILYRHSLPDMKKRMAEDTLSRQETTGQLLKQIAQTLLPILASATIYNLINVIDQAVYAGYVSTDYRTVWGIFTGKYILLYNVPVAIASALSSSTLPTVSASMARGDRKEAAERAGYAIRFCLLIALPCMVGLGCLGEPVMDLLFRHADNALAGQMLNIGSSALLFYSLSTITNGILQGSGNFWAPIYNSAIALAVHELLLSLTLHFGGDDIRFVVIHHCVFPLLVTILNFVSLRKNLGYRQEWKLAVLKPFAASCVMGAVSYALYACTSGFLGGNAALCLSVLIAVPVYGLVLLGIGGLSEDDFSMLPGGGRIASLLKRIKLLR